MRQGENLSPSLIMLCIQLVAEDMIASLNDSNSEIINIKNEDAKVKNEIA